MVEVVVAVISALSLIGVAAIGYLSEKERKRNEAYRQESNERAKIRAQEALLQMNLMIATLDLSYVTSLALTGGHVNGNVEAAQNQAEKAKKKYYDFINTEFMKTNTKEG